MELKKNGAGGYHHGALRETLIDRALHHLAAGVRITELSIRGLAAESGVSKGAPYRHFPSADALIAAVAARGFSLLSEELRQAEPNTPAGIGAAYLRFAVEHRELYRGMYHFPADKISAFPDLAHHADRAFSVLRDSIAGSSAERPDLAAVAAWAYVHGLAELAINDLATSLDVSDPETVELLMRGFDPSRV